MLFLFLLVFDVERVAICKCLQCIKRSRKENLYKRKAEKTNSGISLNGDRDGEIPPPVPSSMSDPAWLLGYFPHWSANLQKWLPSALLVREKREKTWVTVIFQNESEVTDDFEPRCVILSPFIGRFTDDARKISWIFNSLTVLGSPTISCTSLKTSFAFETLTAVWTNVNDIK